MVPISISTTTNGGIPYGASWTNDSWGVYADGQRCHDLFSELWIEDAAGWYPTFAEQVSVTASRTIYHHEELYGRIVQCRTSENDFWSTQGSDLH